MAEETKGAVAAPKRADFVPLNKVANLSELFKHPEFAQRIASAAPRHMNAERLLRTFALAAQKTPKLAQVSPMSFLGACVTLSALGLEPNTPLQHAHLIPFEVNKWNATTRKREYVRTDVQVIIGYPGYLDLIYRGEKVLDVHCDVYWPDEVKSGAFSYEYGSKKHLTHKPSGKPRQPGEEPAGAYMYAKLANGGEEFTVLSLADIHAIRARSQGFKSAMYAYDAAIKDNKDPLRDSRYIEAPWIKDFIQMAKKTALRAGQKWLPKSIELAAAITIDADSEEGRIDFSQIIDGATVMDATYETGPEDPAQITEEKTAPIYAPEVKVPEAEAERVPRGEEVKPQAQRAAKQERKAAPEVKEEEKKPESAATQGPSSTVASTEAASVMEYPLFNAFGEEDDGISGPTDDPVDFAKRFAAACADSDESGKEALAEFNADSIQAAADSKEAAAIISEALKESHVTAETSAEPVEKLKPVNFEELYEIPIVKTDKGHWNTVEWVNTAKRVMAGITDIEHLRGFAQVNEGKSNSLATTARLIYGKALDAQFAKLDKPSPNAELISSEPPPPEEGDPGPTAPTEDYWDGVARQLTVDIQSAKSVSDLIVITRNTAIKTQLKLIKENRPDLAARLDTVYNNHHASLQSV